MKEVSAAENEPFARVLRAILVEDPSGIERLSPDEASRIGLLLEANGLEPLLFDTARREGTSSQLSPDRESGWKTAWLMASGRWAAYRSALEELREIASASEMEIQVTGSAAFALRVYPHPELRPIDWIEAAVEDSRSADLRFALEAWRWSAVDRMTGASQEGAGGTALARDGVEIRLLTLPLLGNAGPSEYLGAGLFGPGLEALCVLNAAEMARRRYARSLILLLDIGLALADSRVTAGRVARLAAKNHLELETALALDIARELLGMEARVPAPAGVEMAEDWKTLRNNCLAMLLQHPADRCVQAAIEEGLRAVRVDHRVTG
jgi:hypothetical protein